MFAYLRLRGEKSLRPAFDFQRLGPWRLLGEQWPQSPRLRESEAIGARGINNGRTAHRNLLFISNLSGAWRTALLGRALRS